MGERKLFKQIEGIFISLVAALESKSTHPIATTVVTYAGQSYKNLLVTEVEEISGHGLKGKVDGKELLASNGKLMKNSISGMILA